MQLGRAFQPSRDTARQPIRSCRDDGRSFGLDLALAGGLLGWGDGPADGMNHGMACWADDCGFGHRQAGQVKRPAGPSRQQRHRCGGQHGVGRPGDGRKWRGEQQKPGSLAGLGAPGQLSTIGGDAGGEPGFGARRVGHAELSADPGQVGNVTVASGLVQRAGAKAGMRARAGPCGPATRWKINPPRRPRTDQQRRRRSLSHSLSRARPRPRSRRGKPAKRKASSRKTIRICRRPDDGAGRTKGCESSRYVTASNHQFRRASHIRQGRCVAHQRFRPTPCRADSGCRPRLEAALPFLGVVEHRGQFAVLGVGPAPCRVDRWRGPVAE